MRRAATLLALFGLLIIAPGASARIDVPTPPRAHVVWGYSNEIMDACSGYPACTDPDAHVIYAPIGLDRFSLAHEKGHLFDAEVLTDHDRAVLMARMGLRPGPWTTSKVITDPTTGLSVLEERGGYNCTPQKCPNELFADAYASCRLHMMPVRRDHRGRLVYSWQSAYGWTPKTNATERGVCRTIRNAARY